MGAAVLKNEKGQTMIAFLLSCVLILSASAILGALALALTLTEQLQYVAFSSSRSYFASDYSQGDQEDAAKSKLENLLATMPLLVGAIKSNWIKVYPQKPGDFKSYVESAGGEVPINRFVGVQIKFEAPILNLQLPLLGSAIEAPGGGSFSSAVNSFLMREPTMLECLDFQKDTISAFKTLNSGYVPSNLTEETVTIMDNGC